MPKTLNFVKKCMGKYSVVFEAYGEESTRETFDGELNYEAGKLFFMVFATMFAWLIYIQEDLDAHQFPEFAISIRVLLTMLCATLIGLRFTKRFRNRPRLMIELMMGFLLIGSAVIAPVAGRYTALYVGGFSLILMVTVFAPIFLKLKIILATLSVLIFFLVGIFFSDMDFYNVSIRYASNDLLIAYVLCILLSYIVNKMKYESWERRQKFMNLAEQTMNLATMVEAASKSKSDFLAKMSHEIRTPMNAITGMAELALRENMSPTAQEHIFTIKQASANLLSIINDILDFSKIESGKLEIVPNDYLFSSLVNDVVSIIRMRIIDARMRFVVNVDCNIPNALYGDETRIRQIMLNILSNAVKYTKKGFIELSISGEKTDEDTILLTIDVTDSGKGIKPEDIGKLFGDFVQVDLVSNKGIEGTGLGLAITKNLVQAMGGDVSVQSEYKKGSVFTITLPQKIRSPETLAKVEKPEEKAVLLYELSDIYADSMICTIDNLGVVCDRVGNDDDLRNKLKAKKYAFLFISYSLLDSVKNILGELNLNTQIVLLAEFGNVTTDKSLSVLAMPVYSLSVANMLNGVSDTFAYNATDNIIARFSAPSARILIVDDISTNLKVAEGLMLPYEMQTDLCLSGVEAIEDVKTNRYDLVFMDHMMPEMDGVETVKHIRELRGEDSYYSDLPIIALTANAVSGTKEMFLDNGFNDFLSKPIDTVKLNAILAKWIPKEKQEKQKEGDKTEDESNIGIKIEGVDVKKGISMTGGTLNFYMQTLTVFHKDGMEKIEQIKKCLETDNFPLYTTYVHALKSATASIGANAISEVAKALELAGKQEDLVFIKAHNSKFLIDLKELLSKIGDLLDASGKDEQNESVDFEFLKAELAKLKKALESLDSSAIDEAANDLQKFTHVKGIGEKIDAILQNVLIGEYDEAVEMIGKVV